MCIELVLMTIMYLLLGMNEVSMLNMLMYEVNVMMHVVLLGLLCMCEFMGIHMNIALVD